MQVNNVGCTNFGGKTIQKEFMTKMKNGTDGLVKYSISPSGLKISNMDIFILKNGKIVGGSNIGLQNGLPFKTVVSFLGKIQRNAADGVDIVKEFLMSKNKI